MRRNGTDPPRQLFLGIDHTAITVGDTEASLRFYRDLLGMRWSAKATTTAPSRSTLITSLERTCRITALRAAAGPGIELLEYLAPRDGRPFPADEHANDLVHRQTILITANAAKWRNRCWKRAQSLFPRGWSPTPRQIGFKRAFLARDPDGHVLEIAEP